MAIKHIPQRTCIACRTVRAKRELLRIVRDSAGRVHADPTGKQAGRGAYLCRARECWEQMLHSPRQLTQALMLTTPIQTEDMVCLSEFAATLPPRENSLAGQSIKSQ